MASFICCSAERRTFAIISHPDAGKTTLTEKLLLYGNAIQLAGNVRARRNQRQRHLGLDGDGAASAGFRSPRRCCSSLMRSGIINLLDTPGHQDFSEDTYRTLAAVDSAVMVLDAAKGIEPRPASCSRSAASAGSRFSHLSTRWTARRATRWQLLG